MTARERWTAHADERLPGVVDVRGELVTAHHQATGVLVLRGPDGWRHRVDGAADVSRMPDGAERVAFSGDGLEAELLVDAGGGAGWLALADLTDDVDDEGAPRIVRARVLARVAVTESGGGAARTWTARDDAGEEACELTLDGLVAAEPEPGPPDAGVRGLLWQLVEDDEPD